MTTTKYEITVIQTRRDLMQLEKLAEHLDVHADLIRRFVDFGLLRPAAVDGAVMMFDLEGMRRLRVIQRLRRDLGINLAGIGVILELLDRLGKMTR